MAARRVYSDEEMARAYVVLQTNQGNVKRTARDLNMPISTVRRWRDEWEASGPPDTTQVEAEVTDFVEHAERVRDKALVALESKLEDATPSALVATVGMLQDKISLARGLATQRTETVHALPPAEDIAKALSTAMTAALHASHQRDEEIIDAEVIEIPTKALPAAEQA